MDWPLQQLVSDPSAASQHDFAHRLKVAVVGGKDISVRPTQAGLLVLGTSELALERAVSGLLAESPGLLVGKPQVNYIPGEVWLEPVCRVTVEVAATSLARVAEDLRQRRAEISSSSTVGERSVLEAEIPMAELFGFSTSLRALSQGSGLYREEYLGYKPSGSSGETLSGRQDR